MKRNLIFGLLFFINNVFGGPIGFDPGMDIQLAASYKQDSQIYYEDCPDSPNGHCKGTIYNMSGFYTLPLIDSDQYACIYNSIGCPYKFQWKRDINNDSYYELVVDSTNFNSKSTYNMYTGLQTNIPNISGMYSGIRYMSNNSPKATDINSVSFDYRGSFCYGDKQSDNVQFGNIIYYISFYSIKKQNGFTLSFLLDSFANFKLEYHPILPINIQRQSDFGVNEEEAYKQHYYINSISEGIIEDHLTIHDKTKDCNLVLENKEWNSVYIPIKSFIQLLIDFGYIDDEVYKTSYYTGEIIGGSEHWGRVKTKTQFKNRTLLSNYPFDIVYNKHVKEGKFRTNDTFGSIIYYSNGIDAYCQYANFTHAGVYNNNDVKIFYDSTPTEMRNDGYCNGYEKFYLYIQEQYWNGSWDK